MELWTGGLKGLSAAQRAVLSSALNGIARLPGVYSIVLFGSYAKGTQSSGSDVDLAVFFDTGRPCLIGEFRQLTRICRNPELDIQVQAFHAFELVDPCGIIEEIVAYGIELYCGARKEAAAR